MNKALWVDALNSNVISNNLLTKTEIDKGCFSIKSIISWTELKFISMLIFFNIVSILSGNENVYIWNAVWWTSGKWSIFKSEVSGEMYIIDVGVTENKIFFNCKNDDGNTDEIIDADATIKSGKSCINININLQNDL